jgi:hypothetical protein
LNCAADQHQQHIEELGEIAHSTAIFMSWLAKQPVLRPGEQPVQPNLYEAGIVETDYETL